MTPLSQLTHRNYLIAAHDALATAFALLASFYLRFEGGEAFYARLPLLLRILPLFVVFSVVICYVFNLTTTKWRFISLPDALNILRVASVLTVALIVLDYAFIFGASSGKAPVLFGRITIVLFWFLQVFALSALRFGYRYFRYSRVRRHAQTEGASSTLLIGRAADAEVLLRGIESGAITNIWPVGILSSSRADRGQSIRGIPVRGNFDMLDNVVNDLVQRGTTVTRVIFTPSALDPDAKPEATLMRARRLGLTVSRLPLTDIDELPDGGLRIGAQVTNSGAAVDARVRADGFSNRSTTPWPASTCGMPDGSALPLAAVSRTAAKSAGVRSSTSRKRGALMRDRPWRRAPA